MINSRKIKILMIFFSILPVVRTIQYLDARHNIFEQFHFFRTTARSEPMEKKDKNLVEASEVEEETAESKVEYIYDPSITEGEVVAFISRLQKVVASGDVTLLAGMLSENGCKFNADPFEPTISIKNEEDLKLVYDKIMTEEMRNIIMEATAENIFNNYQGFMIGDGEVFFDPRDGILVFNLP